MSMVVVAFGYNDKSQIHLRILHSIFNLVKALVKM